MNIAETILSVALLSLAAFGYMELAEQRIYEREAMAVVEDVGVFQDAIIRHHRQNPQDGVAEWVETQHATPGDPTTPVVWRDMRDVAPARLANLDFAGQLTRRSLDATVEHGLERSPYGTPYRLMTDGQSGVLRLEFDVFGITKLTRLTHGQRFGGSRVDVAPQPNSSIHDENTAFVVGVEIRPGLAHTFSAYSLDATDRSRGGFGSPVRWATRRLDDGLTGFGPGEPCGRYADGAVVPAGNGIVLVCVEDTTAPGAFIWRAAHEITSTATVQPAALDPCTGLPDEHPLLVPQVAITAAAANPPTFDSSANLVFTDAFGVVVHVVTSTEWAAIVSAAGGTGDVCLEPLPPTPTCWNGNPPPCTPKPPPDCVGVPGEVNLNVPQDVIDATPRTWSFAGTDVEVRDGSATLLHTIAGSVWDAVHRQAGSNGTVCLQGPTPTCPAGEVLYQHTNACGPLVCDWLGDGQGDPQLMEVEQQWLRAFFGVGTWPLGFTPTIASLRHNVEAYNWETGAPFTLTWRPEVAGGASISAGATHLMCLYAIGEPGDPNGWTSNAMIPPLITALSQAERDAVDYFLNADCASFGRDTNTNRFRMYNC